ncbi:hypothetical protein B0I35DRAFT_446079 [Stachybotrys elegans]|uniref:SMP-30/Gluconolactonase/LRE-like region domain-containing protein n=1 Tax=Stachybotrys elegans TaxID=80388 RepID=A0A8K0WJC9_9HYPO|nr:hypothetical protein B0I35DRAFT_446079 [Stachybotrys elegans]
MYDWVTALILLLLGAMATAVDGHSSAGHVTQIFQWNDTTFIENLTILPDGRLLLVPLSAPQLLILDPRTTNPAPTPVVTLPGVDSVGAIALVGHNKYAIIGGNHSFFSFIEGSMKVFVVSLDFSLGPNGSIGATVENIVSVPNTTMLNGIVALPNKRNVILTNDSIGGRLFRIDTLTSEVTVASGDPAFGRGGNDMVPLGANGIDIRNGDLYFTNSAQGRFMRVGLSDDGFPVGEYTTVAQLDGPITLANSYDDFAFDERGTAYVALHPGTIMKITPDGDQTIFSGGGADSIFLHPTSAVLSNDGESIYVSTGGDWENGVSGGGQILNVKIGQAPC